MEEAPRLSRLAPFVAAITVVGLGVASWPFTVDDAYVVARYATRIAAGHGYTMIDGPPTDGITGPLWLLPAVVASSLHVDPIVVAKMLGLALTALAAALVVARASRALGGTMAGWLTTLVLALSPTLGIWGTAGLETGAATLALTIAALAATKREGRVHPPRVEEHDAPSRKHAPSPLSSATSLTCGLAIAALAWLRPECAPACLAVLSIFLLRSPRTSAPAIGVAAAGAASVLLFRESLFGHALPMSLAAKPALPAHGVAYVARALLLALPSAGLAASGIPHRRARGLMGAERVGSDVPLIAVVVVHLLAVGLAGGDWMPGFRLVAPVLPIAALVTARGVVAIGRRRRALAVAVLVASIALPGLEIAVALPDAREAGRQTERNELARWLRAHAHTVALVDVGYLARDLDVVDLGGITEPHVAYAPGGHLAKRIDGAWLRARAPDTIVLHSDLPPRVVDGELVALAGWPVERRVAQLAWVRREMHVVRVVRLSPSYWYVVLRIRSE